MSVFLPAAFMPGLTGRMYAQFALVIAATALLSAVNAVTLKPTQAALWLRPPVPEERRNFFYRGFNAVYDRMERGYAGLIRRMVTRAGLMATIAFIIIALAGWGLARVPTGFLPIEDQGYLLVAIQLPDGAPLNARRTRLGRSRKSRVPILRSIMWSPSRATPHSITAPCLPMRASPMWCSRIGANGPTCRC